MGWFDDVVGAVGDAVATAGSAVASVASAVADVAEAVVDTVTDVAEDVADVASDTLQATISDSAEAICDATEGPVGDAVCGASKVVAGTANGFIEGAERLFDDGLEIFRDAGDVVFAAVRLDFAGMVFELGDLGLTLTDTAVDLSRVVAGGPIAGSIADEFNRDALQKFVSALIDARFAGDDAQRRRIRDHLHLDRGRFGLNLAAEHRVCVLDSAQRGVDLVDLHRTQRLDLFAAAGLGPSVPSLPTVRTEVVRVDGANKERWDWPVNRSVIQAFLDTAGAAHRLRVYAAERTVMADQMRTAQDSCADVGIKLTWNDPIRFARFSSYIGGHRRGGDAAPVPAGVARPARTSAWHPRGGRNYLRHGCFRRSRCTLRHHGWARAR